MDARGPESDLGYSVSHTRRKGRASLGLYLLSMPQLTAVQHERTRGVSLAELAKMIAQRGMQLTLLESHRTADIDAVELRMGA